MAAASMAVCGCAHATATLDTFQAPAPEQQLVQAVAVLPLRNARLLPSESNTLAERFASALRARDTALRVVGPSAAADSISARGLTDGYARFIVTYAESGMPDRQTLDSIGRALHVDALALGEVTQAVQQDGHLGQSIGRTIVSLRFEILDIRTGTLLWEVASRADKQNATAIGSAPSLMTALSMAEDKIISALPILGQVATPTAR